MRTKESTPQTHQSVKLSVTVQSHLHHKYNDHALTNIKNAIQDWINADAGRGIQTVHVEVDNPEDPTLKEHNVPPVSGAVTNIKIKEVIDKLWKELTPDYLVLFGADDIVPMFHVTNPAYVFKNEDDDKTLPTDNPYASCNLFNKDDEKSYLIPDRVIGRIPDMLSDPCDASRSGDPTWFIEYLKTATNWEPKPASFYNHPYVICTEEAKKAAKKCVNKAFPVPNKDLLVCPPDSDRSIPAERLLSPLHMIKCHGNKKDATFWGFPESAQSKEERCAAISSTTLRQLPQLESSTVVAAMCCYGAQIFLSEDPKIWPLASTYLRKGALGFVGSTMMAWVGRASMDGADWMVSDYLRRILEGASIGRALLESKQDNPGYFYERGQVQGPPDEKTAIEYVLLGDPSIHPVKSVPDCKNQLAVQERRQRRVARALVAAGIHDLLPTRSAATSEQEGKAMDVFDSELAREARKNLKGFTVEPTSCRVQKVGTRFPDSVARGPIRTRESLEFHWGGKRTRGPDKQLCLLKVETDLQARPWRASVMYTS